MSFSSSRIDAFATCTQRYHFKYVEGLEPKVTAPELAFGSLWHEAMEAYYQHRHNAYTHALDALDEAWNRQVCDLGNTGQLWDEDYQRMQEELELLRGMLSHYDDYWGEADRDMVILATEVSFRVPVIKPGGKRPVAYFTGVIDLVELDLETGGIFIWDHKTVSSFGSSWFAQNSIDRQFRRYAWAYEKLTGKEVRGFCVNAARKKLPVPPRELKDGSPSKDKAQDTTYELYMAELTKRNLDPADYTDILEHLKAKGNTFFERDGFAFNEGEIAEVETELYWLYRRMIAKVPPVKTPSPLCTQIRSCPYRVLCVEDTPEARMAFRSTREEMTV
ncbi:MAG: PD-(D/E)XK nuclease family protein [Actinomycetota bacterium]